MNKLIAIGSLVLGFGGGAWWGYHAGSTDSPVPVARTELPTLTIREPGLSAVRSDIDLSVLRTLIREEVTAAVAGKAGGSPTAPTPAQNPASPQMQAERRQALEQIDAMVAQGVWGNEQRFNFQQKLAMLDPQQRQHAMEQFAIALNNGTLKVTTDGPPL
jgi:hypothetical protein